MSAHHHLQPLAHAPGPLQARGCVPCSTGVARRTPRHHQHQPRRHIQHRTIHPLPRQRPKRAITLEPRRRTIPATAPTPPAAPAPLPHTVAPARAPHTPPITRTAPTPQPRNRRIRAHHRRAHAGVAPPQQRWRHGAVVVLPPERAYRLYKSRPARRDAGPMPLVMMITAAAKTADEFERAPA